MSSNIMLIAIKAFNPCSWKSSKPRKNGLYYSNQPVPGIYSENSRGVRHLVALKPNGHRDTENIFYRSPRTSRANSVSSAQTTDTEETTMDSSSRTVVDSHSDDDEKHRYMGLPYVYHRKRNSVCSSYFTSISISEPPKHPIDHTPTQKDRNLRPPPKSKSKFPFWKSSNNSATTKGHLSQIDLVGYRFLVKPEPIEYSTILCSWRFSEEMRARTMVVTGCRGRDDCQGGYACKGNVRLEFMVLDDAQTWVIVNQTAYRKTPKWRTSSSQKQEEHQQLMNDKTENDDPKGGEGEDFLKLKKRGRGKLGLDDNEVLFWAEFKNNGEEETVAFRPFSENDGICARIRVEVYDGRFVCPAGVGEEKSDWMKIVRYCE